MVAFLCLLLGVFFYIIVFCIWHIGTLKEQYETSEQKRKQVMAEAAKTWEENKRLESYKKIADIEDYTNRLLKNTKAKADDIYNKAEADAKTRRQEIEVEANDIRSKAEIGANDIKRKIIVEARNIRSQAILEANTIREKVKTEANDIRKKAEIDAHRIHGATMEKAKSMMQDAERKAHKAEELHLQAVKMVENAKYEASSILQHVKQQADETIAAATAKKQKQAHEVERLQMDFVVLDFETAAQGKIEACEIGLAFVRNGKVVNSQSWFIKPPCYPNFNSYFINRVHGITPMDVANSPTFPGIWNIIHPLIEGKLVFAHNASFDMDVLYQTLAHYKLPFPNFTYGCTLQIARKALPNRKKTEANDGTPYSLGALCKKFNIKFQHHRAGEDARATAELALIMFKQCNIESVEQIENALNLRFGRMTATGEWRQAYNNDKYAKPAKKATKKVTNVIQKTPTITETSPGTYRYQ